MRQQRIREAMGCYQELRTQMARDLAHYLGGTHYTGEFKDGQRTDTTRQTIVKLKRCMADADNLILALKECLENLRARRHSSP